MATATYMSLSSLNNTSSKILVIGETGSGKSTFINYLTNYFKNGALDNLRVAIKTKYRPATESYTHSEANTDDTSKSQTTTCSHYQFTRKGRSYTFLDTPGLGDTRGTNQDDLNIEKIIKSVETFDGITCVLIVMNGTVPRLTVNVQNVIVRLQGFLPDIIMEHVIIVLTNAYRYAANADLEKLLNLNSTVHPFYMQNSAFSTDPKKWDQLALKSLQSDWEISMSELKNLIDLVDTFEVKSVAAFTDMKTLRNDIKSMMHNARLEVENIQKMQDEIAALQAGMKGFDDDLSKNKDYTRKKVAVAQLVDAPYHSTICSDCNHVCHDHCGLQETYQKGNQTLSGCACMGGNNQCGVCKGHCSYTQHYHARKTMQRTSQTIDEVLHDIKAKYDAATTNKNLAQQKLTTTSDKKKMLENALVQKNAEIQKKCLELKKHCSGFNIVAELNIMIKQLETSKQTIRDLDALRQAERFINSLIAFCNQLEKNSAFSDAKQNNHMKIQDNYRSVPQAAQQQAAEWRRYNNDEQGGHDVRDSSDNRPIRNQKPRRNQEFDQRSYSAAENYNNHPQNHPRQQQQHLNQQCNVPVHPAPAAAAAAPTSSYGKNIHVGGFPEGALNHHDLENYFTNYGTILKCFVAIGTGGKLKDYGFVEFDNYNTVIEIMKKSHTINGHAVVVHNARPKAEKKLQNQHQKRPDSAYSQKQFGGSDAAHYSKNDRYQHRNADNDELNDSDASTSSFGSRQHLEQLNIGRENRGSYRGAHRNNRGGYSRDEDSDAEPDRQDPPSAYRVDSGFTRGGERGRGNRRAGGSSRGNRRAGGGGRGGFQ